MNNNTFKIKANAEYEFFDSTGKVKKLKKSYTILNNDIFPITSEELLNIVISRNINNFKLPTILDNKYISYYEILNWISLTFNINFYLLIACKLFVITLPGLKLFLISDKNFEINENKKTSCYKLVWEF